MPQLQLMSLTRLIPPALALLISGIALWPMTRPGLYSDDWNWFDRLARGNLGIGGPFYDLANHGNPLPVEVQVNRIHFALFGANGPAAHTTDLAGHLITLTLLYLLIRRLDATTWVAAAGTLLAGVAPAPISAFTWIAASVHMWATLFALASILCYLTWRRDRTRWAWIAAATALALIGVWTKNDGVLAPVFIIIYELTAGFRLHKRASAAIVVAFAAIGGLFVVWQLTAKDSIRETADPSISGILNNGVGLVKLVLVPDGPSEVYDEYSSGRTIIGVVAAVAVVAASVVVVALALVSLVTRNGRIVLASGIVSAIPVLALGTALESRYCYPLTLCVAAAAALGLQQFLVLARRRKPVGRYVFALAAAALVGTVGVWGGQTHTLAAEGSAPSGEGDALLAGVAASEADLSRGGSIKLIDSPLDANTAAFRFRDPRLPKRLYSRNIQIGGTAEPHLRVQRLPDGVYVVLP